MKNATEYARRIKRLLAQFKGRTDKGTDAADSDVTDQVILAVLMRYASDSVAQATHRRLRERTVDLNELRVTPVEELIDMLGPTFPQAKAAAESLARVLGAIFNRCHHLDLNFLRDLSKKESRTYIETLDGMDPFSSAVVILRVLKQHAVPLDERVLQWLRDEGALPADITHADAQAFVEKIVAPAQAEGMFIAMRRKAHEKPARSASRTGQNGQSRTGGKSGRGARQAKAASATRRLSTQRKSTVAGRKSARAASRPQ